VVNIDRRLGAFQRLNSRFNRRALRRG
jgi:hypothetical protein